MILSPWVATCTTFGATARVSRSISWLIDCKTVHGAAVPFEDVNRRWPPTGKISNPDSTANRHPILMPLLEHAGRQSADASLNGSISEAGLESRQGAKAAGSARM